MHQVLRIGNGNIEILSKDLGKLTLREKRKEYK